MENRGCFVSFTGLNGAGKSSIIDIVLKNLSNQGKQVHTLKLLTSDIANHQDFMHCHDDVNENLDSQIKELELMVSSKLRENKEVILPALLRGETILYDRYIDSTIQHHLRNRTMSSLEIFSRINDLIKPDITIYLRIPPCESMKRITIRDINVSPWQLDKEKVQRSYNIYEKLTKALDYKVVDNFKCPPQESTSQVLNFINNCKLGQIVTYKKHLKNGFDFELSKELQVV